MQTSVYSHPAARQSLFSTLLQLCLIPHPQWPAPVQIAVTVFRQGLQRDDSHQVRSMCQVNVYQIELFRIRKMNLNVFHHIFVALFSQELAFGVIRTLILVCSCNVFNTCDYYYISRLSSLKHFVRNTIKSIYLPKK